MFPHERSLVSKLKNQPFALLGVNTDQNLNQVKQNIRTQNITWRSWYDGSTGGPICKKYQVQGFPTLYLIDHRGVIIKKWLGGPPSNVLDEAIEEAIKEVPKKSG
jgi:hypothetical protein